MNLTLSEKDLRNYQDFVSVLLSPVTYRSPELWTRAACRALRNLCDAHSAAFILPRAESVHLQVDGMDPDGVRRFESFLGPPDGDGSPWSDQSLDQAMSAVKDAGLEVFTSDDVTELTGLPPEKQPYFQEVLKPSGIRSTAAMAYSLSRGRAIISVGHESREGRRFGEDETSLLRLLLPVFHAGVLAQVRLSRQKRAFEEVFEGLGDALAIFDRRGQLHFRNHQLDELARSDPEFDVVNERMEWLAREVARSVTENAMVTSDAGRQGSCTIETGRDRYSLTPTLLPPDMVFPGPAILITVRAATPRLPSEDHLRNRYGLTHRQSEVALLLASGLSNREIAARLTISPHTARHHAQRVLEKVGVSSRKALGLRFLGDVSGP